MPNEIAAAQGLGVGFADMERLAVAIAKSGLFGMRTPEQALVLMAIAQAEGRHPALAARDYDIVNNRPAKKAEAMMRDFVQAGGTVEWHALTDEIADATFTHPQTGSVRIDWDMKRAQTAFGKKEMYTKFPRQMLRSRVVSEGVRTLWPLATSGFYVPEEVDGLPPHNGPTIEAEAPVPEQRAAAASTRRPERKVDTTVYEPPPAEPPYEPAPPVSRFQRATEAQLRAWLGKLRIEAASATSLQEVIDIGGRDSVGEAIATGPDWLQRETSSVLHDAYARFPNEDEDEIPIEGEAAMAG